MEQGALDLDEIKVIRGRRLPGRVRGAYAAGPDSRLESAPVSVLALDLEGIAGDRHYGFSRRSGPREPWYPRNTEMGNERQVTVVAADELAEVARRMELAELKPEWIGANLLVEGVPNLSFLPAGTRLAFEGGAVLMVTGQNAPCRSAGAAIARNVPDRTGLDLLFPQKAMRLRGLIAAVEKAGTVAPGAAFTVHVQEQWIYPA